MKVMHLIAPSFSLPSLAVFSQFPIDWAIVIVFFIIVTFDALRSGPSRAATISLAWPIALFAFGLLPQTFLIGKIFLTIQSQSPIAQAAVFLILLVGFFALIYRTTHIFGSSNGFLFALLAGMSATIITITLWLQEPALQVIWHFGPQIQMIFGGAYTLFWLIGSYIALAFIKS